MDASPFVAHLTFRYIAAYWVEGLQRPAEGILSLHPADEQGKSVSLTDNTHESLNHIDFVQGFFGRLLDKAIGGVDCDPNHFASYQSASYKERARRYGDKSAFLVVEASHVEDGARIGPIRQSDNRNFCLAWPPDGFVDEVKARHKPFLDQSLAFLTFAMPSVSGFERVGGCIVADHPSGKPLYVLSVSMSGRGIVSSPIPADGSKLFRTLFQRQHSGELEYLQTTFRRSAASTLLNTRDNLLAFLFAFTALDAFVSEFFKKYKEQLRQYRKGNLSPPTEIYLRGFERLRSKTECKFALIASYLGFKQLDKIVVEFRDATKCRNAIAHGDPFNEAALPTTKVREWLSELIRLHVAHLNPPAQKRHGDLGSSCSGIKQGD
jgi:hypothetical protein